MPDTPAKTAFSAASTRLQAWPAWAKGSIYGLANTVLLYLCLAPTTALPKEPFSDKIEHALAWLALTGLGLFLWPGRRARVAGFAFTLGVLVELLQAAMPLGRDGDWRDAVADGLGVAAALAAAALARRLFRT